MRPLRPTLAADPRTRAWPTLGSEIAQAVKIQQSIFRLTYIERMRGFASHCRNGTATGARRGGKAEAKPGEDARVSRLRPALVRAAAAFDGADLQNLDIALLSDALSEMQETLGKDNPDVQKVLQGKTPADVAKDLIASTETRRCRRTQATLRRWRGGH